MKEQHQRIKGKHRARQHGVIELADFVRCYNSAFLYLLSPEKKGAESIIEKILRAKPKVQSKEYPIWTSYSQEFMRIIFSGKLSDRRYSRMANANEYEAEQKRLISEVEENEKALIELQKQTVDMKMLYQGLMEFTEMKQLTPTVVNKLIECIEIYNDEKKHSHNNVKVDIYFTAVRLFDIPRERSREMDCPCIAPLWLGRARCRRLGAAHTPHSKPQERAIIKTLQESSVQRFFMQIEF